MDLTVGNLRKIIESLSDDVILAHLEIGNDSFHSFDNLKRILLLKDNADGKEYLTINSMGSHFTGDGEQKNLSYTGKHWDHLNIDKE